MSCAAVVSDDWWSTDTVESLGWMSSEFSTGGLLKVISVSLLNKNKEVNLFEYQRLTWWFYSPHQLLMV